MPMGVVNTDEFLKELNNVSTQIISDQTNPTPANPTTDITEPTPEGTDSGRAEIINLPTRGRSEGDVNVPESLRNLIGSDYSMNRAEGLELARMFDVSASSASAYGNGATSTNSYNTPKKSITDVILTRKNRASKKALTKLNDALDGITPEKLESVKARDLAGIAKDMAAVVKHMEPDTPIQAGGNNVQFVIFAPELRREESFDFIQVNE